MFLSQRYSRFFTSPLGQYFKDFSYNIFEDFPSLSYMQSVSKKDYLRWVKIHQEYLSPFESLAVGISLFLENSMQKDSDIEKAISYFEYAIKNSDDSQVHYLAKLSLGIIYFDIALVRNKGLKQSKLMKVSRFYFNEAAAIVENNELALLYRALTEVGIGEIEEACRYITKASKTSQDPCFLYRVLEKVYHGLGLSNISMFYEAKALSF